ncbi:uncharacterized protein LACBIDRAFT_318602 [Laccaria bicolor S238N-H82]|uniref:Predicted protein n=1 Tax=Laccaria bicolor (strain S238N-H82 / ATCC MYA-4686) TaxID=486041 RepID=B0E2R3_LACBS|nr:uncharacterized protein LACBIDRAFT_318602 [Laccaria bicolor S238N-H82]EDQ98876.1 predicted protein [Laccaria bicolor S238N-H82]|eukprot:XP_001890486.1 predicted protein [Laccaria bicolor S238N-H82]
MKNSLRSRVINESLRKLRGLVTLSPPLEELDEVLAVMFTGPCQPTKKDLQHTPLLVHRKQISKALEWLKLNHSDYFDIRISQENLSQYPLSDAPVTSVNPQVLTTSWDKMANDPS